jgi:hypothetical protein
MQRYNMFYQVHKGLRQMLYTTAGKMLQTDFVNTAETAGLLAQITEVLDLFDGHAETEDHFVLPSVTAYEPSAAAAFEQEHAEDHALGNRLRALLNMFHHAVSSEEKNEMGSAIRLAFTEFLVFNLRHMAKEESYLNNILWSHYTDEQLHGITTAIMANLSPEKIKKNQRWMMLGLSNNEIATWLNIVKREAPEFVFNGLLATGEKELPAQRWKAIKENLSADQLLETA